MAAGAAQQRMEIKVQLWAVQLTENLGAFPIKLHRIPRVVKPISFKTSPKRRPENLSRALP